MPLGLLGAEHLPSRSDLSTAASALPAASTTIDATRLERTPASSYGDLFRSLPGVDVASYGQGSIAYGMAMRGYGEGDHGRDIAYFIDGVPVNEISSSHTANYADTSTSYPCGNGRAHRGYPRPVLGRGRRCQPRRRDIYHHEKLRPLCQPQHVWRLVGDGAVGWRPTAATPGASSPTPRRRSITRTVIAITASRPVQHLQQGDYPARRRRYATFRAQAYGTESGASGYIGREAVQAVPIFAHHRGRSHRRHRQDLAELRRTTRNGPEAATTHRPALPDPRHSDALLGFPRKPAG